MDRDCLVYAASAVDCEGTVQIFKNKRKKMISPSYGVQISVYNTNLSFISFFVPFGGSVQYRDRNEKHKPEYSWHIYGNNAVKFLCDILPFLKLKIKQAELCVQIQNEISKERINSNNISIRETLYQECRSLNRKGR